MKKLIGASLGLALATLPILDANATDAEEVLIFLKEHIVEGYAAADFENATVALGFADLNDDGADEALAYVLGQNWCGSGGCNAYVITPTDGGFSVVMESTVTQTPIGVLKTSTNGWSDIFVSVSGGGVPSGRVAMKFDGERYPRNPTTKGEPIEETNGKVLIGEDDRGIAFD